MYLFGIDLAWNEKNRSGFSSGKLVENSLFVEDIICDVFSVEKIIKKIFKIESPVGISIDAPLIIKNISGQRECEYLIGKSFGKFGASCYPSNLNRFPYSISVRVSEELLRYGIDHINGKNWQIECYPHPAILNLFNLDYRLKYKKGKVYEKRKGQYKLANYIRNLENNNILSMYIPEKHKHILNYKYIMELKGKKLKDNEDKLDSLICLYVAGMHALGKNKVFGNKEEGYICVPEKTI